MDVKIIPRRLSGEIEAITSKSAAHRTLICAALCDKPTDIKIDNFSKDIEVTMKCLEVMKNEKSPTINCGESGSTLRFLLPVCAVICENAEFIGEGRLPERPIKDLLMTLQSNGVNISSDKIPFAVSGRLKNGAFFLPGNISSQFVSGLLFALPLLEGDSKIILTSELESKSYVNLTLQVLKKFNINIEKKENIFFINGNRKYVSPGKITIEKDWSNAAFFLAAGALEKSFDKSVRVTGLDINSEQGDKEIIRILRKFCAAVNVTEKAVTVHPEDLKDTEIDVSEIPDLLPILAVLGACANGKTVLYNAARLRIKESDRLSSVSNMLNNLGADIREYSDKLDIYGDGKKLRGGIVDGAGDHRIVMSAAICASFCEREVIIKGAEAVEKSYPKFFEDYKKLGGEVHVI